MKKNNKSHILKVISDEYFILSDDRKNILQEKNVYLQLCYLLWNYEVIILKVLFPQFGKNLKRLEQRFLMKKFSIRSKVHRKRYFTLFYFIFN